jgi:hypothetical protein
MIVDTTPEPTRGCVTGFLKLESRLQVDEVGRLPSRWGGNDLDNDTRKASLRSQRKPALSLILEQDLGSRRQTGPIRRLHGYGLPVAVTRRLTLGFSDGAGNLTIGWKPAAMGEA